MNNNDNGLFTLDEILGKYTDERLRPYGIVIAKYDNAFYAVIASDAENRVPDDDAAARIAEKIGIPVYKNRQLPASISGFCGIIKEKSGKNLENAEKDITAEYGTVFGRKDTNTEEKIFLGDILNYMDFDAAVNKTDGTIRLVDQQGAYLGDRPYSGFRSAVEVFDRLDAEINDYYIKLLTEDMENSGIDTDSTNTWEDLIRLAEEKMPHDYTDDSFFREIKAVVCSPESVQLPAGVIEKSVSPAEEEKNVLSAVQDELERQKMGYMEAFSAVRVENSFSDVPEYSVAARNRKSGTFTVWKSFTEDSGLNYGHYDLSFQTAARLMGAENIKQKNRRHEDDGRSDR